MDLKLWLTEKFVDLFLWKTFFFVENFVDHGKIFFVANFFICRKCP